MKDDDAKARTLLDGGDPARLGPLTRRMLSETPFAEAWRLNFVANSFTGPMYKALAEFDGLSRPEFVILACVLQAGETTATEICEATGLPKNSISRAIADLERRGLIDRSSRDDDRRAKTLTGTAEAEALLARVAPKVVARQEAMLEALTTEERAALSALLDKLALDAPRWAATD